MNSVRNEKGSVLVFVTLMIVLLMVMVGMGLDTGQLTATRSHGQAAVDAAALAAVTGLALGNNEQQVYDRAAALSNEYSIDDKNVTFVTYDWGQNRITGKATFETANGVRVALESSNPYDGGAEKTPIVTRVFLTPLMNLLGFDMPGTQNISVTATAVYSAQPSIPIALWDSVCDGDSTVTGVKIAQQNQNDDENSCWTTYLDKSSGADDIRDLFKASSTCDGIPQGEIDIGIPIYENKGQAATVYEAAIDLFFENPATKNRCWIIPVIQDPLGKNCNQKNPTPITDWAKVCPTSAVKHGSHSYIEADVTCRQRLRDSKASVCFSTRLVRDHASSM